MMARRTGYFSSTVQTIGLVVNLGPIWLHIKICHLEFGAFQDMHYSVEYICMGALGKCFSIMGLFSTEYK